MRVLGDDRGAVTVEAALALCSLVAVMVMVIAAVSAASANLRCLDAAREAARLVSRGEPQRAQEVAAVVAPRGATVDVRVTGDEVNVRVTAAVVPGIRGLSLVGVAVAVMEPAAFLAAGAGPDSVPDPAADATGPASAAGTQSATDTQSATGTQSATDTPSAPGPANPTEPDSGEAGEPSDPGSPP